MNTLSLFRPLVQELLAESLPRHILVNCPAARELASGAPDSPAISEVAAAELLAGQWPERADLAVVLLAPADRDHASALIAALRDLYARRVLLFLPPAAFEWKQETLIGLGLSQLANYDSDGEAWQAWSFDIRTYKSVPDWLNPRFWANPENWGKYRW
jgi:hypothetical protein